MASILDCYSVELGSIPQLVNFCSQQTRFLFNAFNAQLVNWRIFIIWIIFKYVLCIKIKKTKIGFLPPTFRAWKFDQRLNFEARVFKFSLNERSTCLLKHWFVKNEQLYKYCPVILDERDVTSGRFASVRCKTWASIRANWTIISWPKTFVFHYQTPRSTDLCEMKFIVQ